MSTVMYGFGCAVASASFSSNTMSQGEYSGVAGQGVCARRTAVAHNRNTSRHREPISIDQHRQQGYAARDPQQARQCARHEADIHRHRHRYVQSDRGQSDALNKGIDMARAEYIGILNADDFYEPGALSCVAAIIKNLPGPRFIVGACNVLTTGDKVAEVNRPSVLKFENLMIDPGKWPFPYNPAAYFYPKAVHDVVGRYNIEEHFGMDLEFILAVVQAIKPLYIDAVLGNFRLIPGTKTFNNIMDGSNRTINRKIRIAAWKRASLKIKIRVAFLWMLHRMEKCAHSRPAS